MKNAQIGQLNVASGLADYQWTATCVYIGPLAVVEFVREHWCCATDIHPNIHICIPRKPTALYSCIKLNLSVMRNTLSCKFKYEFMHIAFANTFIFIRIQIHANINALRICRTVVDVLRYWTTR